MRFRRRDQLPRLEACRTSMSLDQIYSKHVGEPKAQPASISGHRDILKSLAPDCLF